MKTQMTCTEKRNLLDSFAGKYVNISWTKGDGTHREAVVQHMQHKLFSEGHASKAHANPVAGKEHLYTCVDTNKQGWVNLNLNTLKSVKCGSVHYEF